MSDRPKDELAFQIWRREKRLGRALTDAERAVVEKAHRECQREPDLMDKAQAALAILRSRYRFQQSLKVRQGTVMPDLEALYAKKAAIDRRLSEQ